MVSMHCTEALMAKASRDRMLMLWQSNPILLIPEGDVENKRQVRKKKAKTARLEQRLECDRGQPHWE